MFRKDNYADKNEGLRAFQSNSEFGFNRTPKQGFEGDTPFANCGGYCFKVEKYGIPYTFTYVAGYFPLIHIEARITINQSRKWGKAEFIYPESVRHLESIEEICLLLIEEYKKEYKEEFSQLNTSNKQLSLF